jgi:hypothetical protein
MLPRCQPAAADAEPAASRFHYYAERCRLRHRFQRRHAIFIFEFSRFSFTFREAAAASSAFGLLPRAAFRLRYEALAGRHLLISPLHFDSRRQRRFIPFSPRFDISPLHALSLLSHGFRLLPPPKSRCFRRRLTARFSLIFS